MIGELFVEGLRNLSRHKLRSLLTALGIIFGIASVMAMVSTGEGARRAILAEIDQLGTRNIIVNSLEPPAEQRTLKEDEVRVRRYGLTFRDLQQIRETVPVVSNTLAVHDEQRWVWFGSRRFAAKVRGVSTGYLETLNLEPALGRSLTDVDNEQRRRVCVVRARLLRDAGYVGDPLQLDLKVGDEYLQVVGVLDDVEIQSSNRAVLGIDQRAFEVYAPFDTVVHRFGLTSKPISQQSAELTRVELHQIVCEAASSEAVIDAARCIRTAIASLHDEQDYQIVVPLELLASMERTQRVFNIVLPIIAGISLLVGGIGILNIMLASITERTREIGIRRAIGATQADITAQFLIETVVLAAVGGVCGVALGTAGALVLERFTEWQPVITGWAIALSLGIACTTGVVFGLYPARRAARMRPIEALRHE
ncbi:MAG: ABC transporter permease [Planctomycetota bacterium]